MALTVVKRFLTLSEAQVAVSSLKSAGLFAIVMNETVGSTWPHMWMAMQGIDVAVDDREADIARAILAEADVTRPTLPAEEMREPRGLGDRLLTATGVVAAVLTGTPFVRKRWRRA